MKRLIVSIYKEFLLLARDIEGIALLFLMPVTLVIVITLIQDRSFKNIFESRIELLIIDADIDSLGHSFREGIKQSEIFKVTEYISADSNILKQARQEVAEGKFQIGIYIPQNTTHKIKSKAIQLVQRQLPFTLSSDNNSESSPASIQLFFDPITKESFKNLAKSRLSEFAAQTETQIIFETYSKIIDALTNQSSAIRYPSEPIIRFDEVLVSEYTSGITPNTVQHNVPAWTIFGMFLICIPIAGNIIKERNDGCLARLKTLPISYFTIITGKLVVFIIICLIQALLIMLIGMYLLPLLDMPKLQVSDWLTLFLITLASSFAATGYGIVIGTIASTQTQASIFGSVSTVILAAIGGVWIPVTVMPDAMRSISEISPMNWSIQGYYNVFLRSSGFTEILPEFSMLMIFYGCCTLLSLFFRKYQANK
jgi:ABC-2 type transport system permease protein